MAPPTDPRRSQQSREQLENGLHRRRRAAGRTPDAGVPLLAATRADVSRGSKARRAPRDPVAPRLCEYVLEFANLTFKTSKVCYANNCKTAFATAVDPPRLGPTEKMISVDLRHRLIGPATCLAVVALGLAVALWPCEASLATAVSFLVTMAATGAVMAATTALVQLTDSLPETRARLRVPCRGLPRVAAADETPARR